MLYGMGELGAPYWANFDQTPAQGEACPPGLVTLPDGRCVPPGQAQVIQQDTAANTMIVPQEDTSAALYRAGAIGKARRLSRLLNKYMATKSKRDSLNQMAKVETRKKRAKRIQNRIYSLNKQLSRMRAQYLRLGGQAHELPKDNLGINGMGALDFGSVKDPINILLIGGGLWILWKYRKKLGLR